MLALAMLKGTGWLIFSRLFGRAIDFLNLLILARLLSPADFGLTALAMALVMLLDTILDVPVTQALIRLDEINKQHLDTGFTLAVLRSFAITGAALACAWPYAWLNNDPALVPVVCVLAIGPAVKGLYSPAMVHLARMIDFRPTFLLEVISKICGLGCAMLVVFNGGGYWAIVTNYIGAAVAATIMSYVFARYRPVFSFSRIKDFAGFMGWFTSAQVISALAWQYDRLLIGTYAGDKAVLGRYTVASDISLIPSQSLIAPAYQPMMSAFSQMSTDRVRLAAAFLKAVRLVMLISVPASIGIALTSDLLTQLLLGTKWLGAAPYLALLAISVMPAPYYQTINAVSLATDRPSVVFRISIVELVLRVTSIAIGFYLASIEGVLYARLLLSLLMFVVYLDEVRRLLSISIMRQLLNLWKIAVAGPLMAIVVSFARLYISELQFPDILQMGLIASIGAATYCSLLLMLRVRLRLTGGRFEIADIG
ncbi:lipopolysaccharide biosynthesis protein [Neorhizobium sp. JUb45]|uniref:lipopolysaccharide biosynthesis protein n=1 Tax=unclassified Neorhizobium TaxID=2629175 RepID=UPI00104E6693|nr:lipopolysaccharide biosynthesis protein [Neorhizobium sp. JUb45]TCQ99971.1 PST family polysaccharide transporter [Neorhizobium sp. JUb45]